MTPEIGMWLIGGILGVLVVVLGFIAAWQFNKIIELGERLSTHATEITNLRAAMIKTETDLRAQHDKTEGSITGAVGKLEAALTIMAHSIEKKMDTMHGRLDTLLMQRAQHRATDVDREQG